MKIWHDNSGKGNNASWYLKKVIVNDLQTNETFCFICEKWLSVEKCDEKIERDLFVACEPQKRDLKYLISKQVGQGFKNYHLWISIFKRPVTSSFTRLDRITCGFVFLYFSMMVNIFWYRMNSMKNQFSTIDFVIISISTEQVI